VVLPLLDLALLKRNTRIPSRIVFAPACWIVAHRSAVERVDSAFRLDLKEASDVYARFKAGDAALASPLTEAMAAQLRRA
jgi:hypothetical protein